MKTYRSIVAAAALAAAVTGPVIPAERAEAAFVNSAGPRLGAIYLADKDSREALRSKNAGKMLTVMGWQFEHEYFNTGTGVAGLIELVPAVAGMETGLFLPSVTALIGVRVFGLELGMGPSVGVGVKKRADPAAASGVRYVAATGMGQAIVLGKTFRHGPVNFPVNLVGIRNDTGYRAAILLGWHMRQGSL